MKDGEGIGVGINLSAIQVAANGLSGLFSGNFCASRCVVCADKWQWDAADATSCSRCNAVRALRYLKTKIASI